RCWKEWWPGTESNRRRRPFQGRALPTELPGRGEKRSWQYRNRAKECQTAGKIAGFRKSVDGFFLRCIISRVGWGWPKVSRFARAVRHLNIDSTRQCQLGRRIAPPVIATFELARVICGQLVKLARRFAS